MRWHFGNISTRFKIFVRIFLLSICGCKVDKHGTKVSWHHWWITNVHNHSMNSNTWSVKDCRKRLNLCHMWLLPVKLACSKHVAFGHPKHHQRNNPPKWNNTSEYCFLELMETLLDTGHETESGVLHILRAQTNSAIGYLASSHIFSAPKRSLPVCLDFCEKWQTAMNWYISHLETDYVAAVTFESSYGNERWAVKRINCAVNRAPAQIS